MNIERIMGGAAAAFGGFLILYLIPNYVTYVEGMMSPTLFPSIAAWLFLILGLIQMITSSEPITLPSTREFLRTAVVALVMFTSIFVMGWVGYLIVAFAFMAILTVFMYERRPVWMVSTIIVMPIGVWLFFEVLLRRPLPSLPF